MRRIKLTVAYDGTAYKGWQLQPNGVTIEEMLNKALSDLLKEPVCVIGASRTDSGVHARGNVAVFDTESRIPGDKFCYAVNRGLPEDIRVVESEEVPLDWHPRKQNCVKTYEYQILNCKIEIPTRRLYAHFCYYPLNVEKMNEAAKYLIGEHDFISFCAANHQAEETVRRYSDMVYRLAFARTGNTADAEDVYQEVFLRYLRSDPQFTSEEHRKAWLLRVTINCAKKLHAAPWRRRTEPLSETLEAPSPEGEALWEELRRLPDKYRTVLHLYYYEDMTTEEIARLLDRSPATVRSQLMRGRDRLRVLLEEG